MRRATWHVRAGSIVVAWLLAALIAGAASLARDLPAWLLVHLLLLGAVSNAILIWSAHFSAAMLRLPDGGRHREEAARLALFNAGAICVVIGMTVIDIPMTAWALAIAGGVIVAQVAIWHAVDLISRLRRALPSRFGATVWYYVVAGLLLPFGIVIGLLLAPDDLPEDRHAQLALAHVSINVLGWVGLTMLGTLVTLWPTMLHTQVAEGAERSARRALPVLTLGVVVVAGGALVAVRPLAVLGIALYLVGVGLLAKGRFDETRRRRPSTFATWSVLAAFGWFAGSVIALGAILALAPDWETAAEAADRLATPLLLGFAAQLVIGALSFLIPVVLGGGPAMARATNAILDRLAPWRVLVVNLGLVASVLPLAQPVRLAGVIASFVALASFLPLAVWAVVRSRRPIDRAVSPAPTGRGGRA